MLLDELALCTLASTRCAEDYSVDQCFWIELGLDGLCGPYDYSCMITL